jgi:protein-disulfide isomerase
MALRLPVDPARDHIEGPDDAPVTLVEYGDYECPHCGRAHPIVRRIQEAMGDRLRFVFRNFPLSEIHPNAVAAAESAEAANAQGKFWEMNHSLFLHQRDLSMENLKHLATNLGLDADRVIEEIETDVYSEHVREDFLSGVRSGVNGTPTFFINGERHDASWDEETLLAALQAAAEK